MNIENLSGELPGPRPLRRVMDIDIGSKSRIWSRGQPPSYGVGKVRNLAYSNRTVRWRPPRHMIIQPVYARWKVSEIEQSQTSLNRVLL